MVDNIIPIGKIEARLDRNEMEWFEYHVNSFKKGALAQHTGLMPRSTIHHILNRYLGISREKMKARGLWDAGRVKYRF
jgi:hypothetical protein